MALSVIIVGARDRSLEERLRNEGMQVSGITGDQLQGLAHPSTTPPDILILDLRGDTQIPRSLASVKRQHSEIGLLLVAAALDPTLMLEAMRSGVTECVTDIAHGELEAAINRLASQRATPVTGDVFVFVGAKGGVGTTTAAVNIATALSKFGSTLVIDLHLAGGDAALLLGAESRFSVIDALENTHRLDSAYFRGLLARTKAGPDLLTSADRAVAVPVDSPRIRTLIEFAARHYRFTVIDIPRSDSAVLDALEGATGIIVVANQELSTVRGAGRVATILRQRYGTGKVSIVLSRSDRQAEIGLEDLQRAVGGSVAATFPSDYRLAVKALNRGLPLIVDGGKSPLVSAFQDYAKTLAGPAAKSTKDTPPDKGSGGGLFGMLTGRR